MSRTAWRDYMAGYAEAVFDGVSQTNELEDIEDELFRFARVVEATPALRSALADMSVPLERRDQRRRRPARAQGARRPRSGSSHLVLRAGRATSVSSLDWLAEQAARARGWRVARVRTALPIDDRRAAASWPRPSSGSPANPSSCRSWPTRASSAVP